MDHLETSSTLTDVVWFSSCQHNAERIRKQLKVEETSDYHLLRAGGYQKFHTTAHDLTVMF